MTDGWQTAKGASRQQQNSIRIEVIPTKFRGVKSFKVDVGQCAMVYRCHSFQAEHKALPKQ